VLFAVLELLSPLHQLVAKWPVLLFIQQIDDRTSSTCELLVISKTLTMLLSTTKLQCNSEQDAVRDGRLRPSAYTWELDETWRPALLWSNGSIM